MFIDILEFTIPVDLCSLCTSLQKHSSPDLEFPASVNSYGTTQDANIQVVLKANKITFRVDGVSSNASMISKSESKTLKLSVFDVDQSLLPQPPEDSYFPNISTRPSVTFPAKRTCESELSVSLPVPSKMSKTIRNSQPTMFEAEKNGSESSAHRLTSKISHSSKQPSCDRQIFVKNEPEEPPDLIEIDPDPATSVKEEKSYMDENYSCSKSLDRLSAGQSSQFQQFSTSSHQNYVPHVQSNSQPTDFPDVPIMAEINPDDDEYEDYSNHGVLDSDQHTKTRNLSCFGRFPSNTHDKAPVGSQEGHSTRSLMQSYLGKKVTGSYICQQCGKIFGDNSGLRYHRMAVHDKITFPCACGKIYKYRASLVFHRKMCSYQSNINEDI